MPWASLVTLSRNRNAVKGRGTELTDIVVGKAPGPPQYVHSSDPHSPTEAT
jgi:hypothetical protein